MKMDSYHHIQLGSVHCGRTLVPNEEVIELYGGTHVPLYIMDDHLHRSGLEGKFSSNMTQFLDRFSNPEATLFADISEVSVVCLLLLLLLLLLSLLYLGIAVNIPCYFN